ncbi:hypothetical protein [Agarivorans sp. B2Z047]|nr:hypothetical protein [Agarivorans sp. B2Z047]UQN42885.1 hypothetical protein LQZ07_24460 [Agarivorans sp. B2Z047]
MKKSIIALSVALFIGSFGAHAAAPALSLEQVKEVKVNFNKDTWNT